MMNLSESSFCPEFTLEMLRSAKDFGSNLLVSCFTPSDSEKMILFFSGVLSLAKSKSSLVAAVL
jgi:hypothetical protein